MLLYDRFYKPRLRVCLVTPGLQLGGAEMWLRTLLQHSATVKYVGVVSLNKVEGMDRSFVAGVPVHSIESSEPQRICEAVRELIRDTGCDMVVYWGLHRQAAMLELGLPIVHVSHASGLEKSEHWGQRQLLDFGETSAHFLAAVSQSASLLFSEEARRKEAVRVIHNGADVERTRPKMGGKRLREQYAISHNSFLVLYVGRFSPEKGVLKLLRAIEQLGRDDVDLMLFGWGAQAEELKRLAKGLLPPSSKGSCARVFFPQPHGANLGDIYDAADLVVLPSDMEAFPLVLIEAWQAGVPVACSEFTTLREIEEEYGCGELLAAHMKCPPSVSEIAATIQFAADGDYAGDMMRAQHIALKHFTASAMVHRWETYFHDCHREWLTVGQRGILQIAETRNS